MVITDFLIFIIALAVLIKGSDILVTAASSLAKSMDVSEFIIGLTIVSVGTSIPELATVVSASILSDGDLIIGTILGSNIANIGLVLGIAAVISVLKIDKVALYRDGMLLLFTSLLFLLIAIDGQITMTEGIILLVLFVTYFYYLIIFKPSEELGYEQYLRYLWSFIRPRSYQRNTDIRNHEKKKTAVNRKLIIKNLFIVLFAIAVLAMSSAYLVPAALNIAGELGVSATLIGFFMIAIGTSLPELIVSITAIYRGLNNILIGNIIGSNIANLLLVGGVASIISPLVINDLALFYMIPFMIFMTLLFLQFIRTTWFIRKLEGIIFLVLYFSFTVFVFFIL